MTGKPQQSEPNDPVPTVAAGTVAAGTVTNADERSRGDRTPAETPGAPVLMVSREDLLSATPLPSPLPGGRGSSGESSAPGTERPRRRWNRVAVWSFCIGLLGIPLFGLITGLVAMILGCIASPCVRFPSG